MTTLFDQDAPPTTPLRVRMTWAETELLAHGGVHHRAPMDVTGILVPSAFPASLAVKVDRSVSSTTWGDKIAVPVPHLESLGVHLESLGRWAQHPASPWHTGPDPFRPGL